MDALTQTVTNILSFGTVVADIVAVLLMVILLTPLSEKGMTKKIGKFFGSNAILLSFLLAGGGTVGSLFYSEYAHFAPCELCWIQRGLLYTQAIVLAIALFARKSEHVKKFESLTRKICLVLSGVGFPVGAYHEYLQLGGGALVPCSATGPSCQYVYFLQYGYVTIPAMSLTAFTLILIFFLFRMEEEKTI